MASAIFSMMPWCPSTFQFFKCSNQGNYKSTFGNFLELRPTSAAASKIVCACISQISGWGMANLSHSNLSNSLADTGMQSVILNSSVMFCFWMTSSLSKACGRSALSTTCIRSSPKRCWTTKADRTSDFMDSNEGVTPGSENCTWAMANKKQGTERHHASVTFAIFCECFEQPLKLGQWVVAQILSSLSMQTTGAYTTHKPRDDNQQCMLSRLKYNFYKRATQSRDPPTSSVPWHLWLVQSFFLFLLHLSIYLFTHAYRYVYILHISTFSLSASYTLTYQSWVGQRCGPVSCFVLILSRVPLQSKEPIWAQDFTHCVCELFKSSGRQGEVEMPSKEPKTPHFILHGSFHTWGYHQIINGNRFSIVNRPFWGTPSSGNPHMFLGTSCSSPTVSHLLKSFCL